MKQIIISLKFQISFFLLIQYIVICVSCSNEGDNGTLRDTANKIIVKAQGIGSETLNKPFLIPSYLNVLYLENDPTNDDLADLLTQGPGSSVQKLVFNFCVTQAKELSLSVWAAERGNRRFHTTSIKTLTPLKETGETIDDKEVILGNQEIDDLLPLRTIVNRASHKYIIFTPKIVTLGDHQFVVYHLTGVRSLTEVSLVPIDIVDTKPSPPASAF
jgi:hypothetical protein